MNGVDCVCMAHHQYECGCDADWTTPEVRQLENRVAELEEALGELWFTCGKFWDGDDSIKRLLRQVKTKEQDNAQTTNYTANKRHLAS